MIDETPMEEVPTENGAVDLDRIHIQNLPYHLGFKQFKKVLEKSLGAIKTKKVRQMAQDAYISFETPEDAQASLKILNGLEIKKNILSAKLAQPEPRKFQPARHNEENNEEAAVTPKTARESVTPYADVPYDEQLRLKDKECGKLLQRLTEQMRRANITTTKGSILLKTIKPSPKIRHYRNKCEFTVGKALTGETIVGFVGGRFSKNQHYVIPVDDVDNITDHCKSIVKEFEKFIIDSGLPTFDEYTRTGMWKMLTVREFTGDVMLIVTAAPFADEEQEKSVRESLVKHFMDESVFDEKKVRITSIYWQTQSNSSDPVQYEHVTGVPYIYETVLDCRFRVSPSAFFQTNSQAASVLYTTIGEACGFSEATIPSASEDQSDQEPETKKIKLEDDNPIKEEEKPAKVLLDICCGTGTIGQCLIKKFNSGNICCIGVEMIASAIEDAKQNAKDNGIRNIKYIAGKAEDVFRSLKYYLPSGVSLESSEVVGVLDPPRAGMHEKVILGCRDMSKMTKLVFVSCDPAAAMKNLVDLCRPESKKFSGKAFSIETIQPVDMFPQTKHFEWVVTLSR